MNKPKTMTVKDLIDALSKMPRESRIVIEWNSDKACTYICVAPKRITKTTWTNIGWVPAEKVVVIDCGTSKT